MENLYEKPKQGDKLEASSVNSEIKPIDTSKEIKDASVNPKINSEDKSKEIKGTSLYSEVTTIKQEPLNNLYNKVELKPEDIKKDNINKPISKSDPIQSIGEIDNTIKSIPSTDKLQNVNGTLTKSEPVTDLGNVNPPKKTN